MGRVWEGGGGLYADDCRSKNSHPGLAASVDGRGGG